MLVDALTIKQYRQSDTQSARRQTRWDGPWPYRRRVRARSSPRVSTGRQSASTSENTAAAWACRKTKPPDEPGFRTRHGARSRPARTTTPPTRRSSGWPGPSCWTRPNSCACASAATSMLPRSATCRPWARPWPCSRSSSQTGASIPGPGGSLWSCTTCWPRADVLGAAVRRRQRGGQPGAEPVELGADELERPVLIGSDDGHDGAVVPDVHPVLGIAQVHHSQQGGARRPGVLDFVVVGHGPKGPVEGVLLLLAPPLDESDVVL